MKNCSSRKLLLRSCCSLHFQSGSYNVYEYDVETLSLSSTGFHPGCWEASIETNAISA